VTQASIVVPGEQAQEKPAIGQNRPGQQGIMPQPRGQVKLPG